MYLFIHAEYGVDLDEHYWLIITHQCIVAVEAAGVLIALETIYILWIVHACALFEIVGCVYDLSQINGYLRILCWNR